MRANAPDRTKKPTPGQRPPGTRKHTVLPVSIRLKSTEKTPACVSMRAFLQPISARIYFGKTASHRKSARFVQSRGALPQAYWMSVKAAQRRGCAKRAFCGVCFLMPGGLRPGVVCVPINPTPLSFRTSDTGGQSRPPLQTRNDSALRCGAMLASPHRYSVRQRV